MCLNIYLHASTLAGMDDLAGELVGHGTLTAETARAIAASADTVRALIAQPAADAYSPEHDPQTCPCCRGAARGRGDAPTHGDGADPGEVHATGSELHAVHGGHSPDRVRSRTCGTVLDAGRAVYRPPTATSDYVTARDRRCQFPGCRAPAARCDPDHRRAYDAGGATCPCNLDLLCRWHHQVKTFTGWRATPGADGRLIWVSPTGNSYGKEPAHPLLDHSLLDHPPDVARAGLSPRSGTDGEGFRRTAEREPWRAAPDGDPVGRAVLPSLGHADFGAGADGGDDPPPF